MAVETRVYHVKVNTKSAVAVGSAVDDFFSQDMVSFELEPGYQIW